MPLDGKHVMITGAAGFIGSRLVERFLEMSELGSITALSHKATIQHKQDSKLTHWVGNVLERQSMQFKKDFDAVYHLAALKPLERNMEMLRRVNYDGTVNVFESVRERTRAFIYVSGAAIFSRPAEGGMVIDEGSPKSADTEYVRIRLEAERFLRDSCRDSGVDFAVVYMPDIVYGNRGEFRSMFLERMRAGKFMVAGSGHYVRPLVHLDDAVDFLVRILEIGRANDSFIVADSDPVPFREFVNYIADLLSVRRPSTVPAILAQLVLGKDLTKMLTRSVPMISNAKMTRIYDLQYPSYKEGIAEVVSQFLSS